MAAQDLRIVVFDFDGTLADSLPGVIEGMSAAFAEARLPVPTPEQIALQIGRPLAIIVRNLLPAERLDAPGDEAAARVEELVTHLVARYRQLQIPIIARSLRLFPGAVELLDALDEQGLLAAIASNKTRADLVGNLRQLGVEERFVRVVAGDDHPPERRKPRPDPLLELLDDLGIRPGQAVMVGDTVYDLQMGKAAGCRVVAVTHGSHTEEQLAAEEPDHLVASLAELSALLAR